MVALFFFHSHAILKPVPFFLSFFSRRKRHRLTQRYSSATVAPICLNVRWNHVICVHKTKIKVVLLFGRFRMKDGVKKNEKQSKWKKKTVINDVQSRENYERDSSNVRGRCDPFYILFLTLIFYIHIYNSNVLFYFIGLDYVCYTYQLC